MKIRQLTKVVIAGAFVGLLTGCGTVAINDVHPALENDPTQPWASVYFIRPAPFKSKGIADNPVQILYDDTKLLDLDEGRHTLVRLKPGQGTVTVNSMTMFTNNLSPVEVSRSQEYKFVASKTYFIHVKQINEEFRGVFYYPAPVDLATATKLAEPTRAGGLARKFPITAVDPASVPGVTGGPMQPALPEGLYRSEPYLIK